MVYPQGVGHEARLSRLGEIEGLERDRFYLAPDNLTRLQDLPLPWMFELAQLIVAGGHVGVMSNDPGSLKLAVALLSQPD